MNLLRSFFKDRYKKTIGPGTGLPTRVCVDMPCQTACPEAGQQIKPTYQMTAKLSISKLRRGRPDAGVLSRLDSGPKKPYLVVWLTS
jgi:hypothetical protein